MREFTVYTDGAVSGNGTEGAAGGWAAILISDKDKIKEISGGVTNTTNQRMELQAVIEALKVFTEPSKIKIHSDSAYVVNCFKQGWYRNWLKNGWVNSKGQAVANRDQWEELLQLLKSHDYEFVKVKGHANDEYNNRCDRLAVAAKPI